jgi:hypothetical protein
MDDAGVLSWENLSDDGENDAATMVSASELFVDVECLTGFLGCKGFGTNVWLASNFATVLAT